MNKNAPISRPPSSVPPKLSHITRASYLSYVASWLLKTVPNPATKCLGRGSSLEQVCLLAIPGLCRCACTATSAPQALTSADSRNPELYRDGNIPDLAAKLEMYKYMCSQIEGISEWYTFKTHWNWCWTIEKKLGGIVNQGPVANVYGAQVVLPAAFVIALMLIAMRAMQRLLQLRWPPVQTLRCLSSQRGRATSMCPTKSFATSRPPLRAFCDASFPSPSPSPIRCTIARCFRGDHFVTT